MPFGNHWALIGILLGFWFALGGLRGAIRRGREGKGRHRCGTWVAVSVAVGSTSAVKVGRGVTEIVGVRVASVDVGTCPPAANAVTEGV